MKKWEIKIDVPQLMTIPIIIGFIAMFFNYGKPVNFESINWRDILHLSVILIPIVGRVWGAW